MLAATGGGRDEGGGMLRSSAAGVGRWGAVEEGNVSAKSFRVVCVYVEINDDTVIHLFLTRFGLKNYT